MNNPHWDKSTGLDEEERKILEQVCLEVGISCSVVEEMIAAEQRVYGMGRRHGIKEVLETLVTKAVEEVEDAT